MTANKRRLLTVLIILILAPFLFDKVLFLIFFILSGGNLTADSVIGIYSIFLNPISFIFYALIVAYVVMRDRKKEALKVNNSIQVIESSSWSRLAAYQKIIVLILVAVLFLVAYFYISRI